MSTYETETALTTYIVLVIHADEQEVYGLFLNEPDAEQFAQTARDEWGATANVLPLKAAS